MNIREHDDIDGGEMEKRIYEADPIDWNLRFCLISSTIWL